SRPATSSPSMWTRPEVGSTMRLIIRIRVVLPEPEEPTSTTDSCEAISRLKSSTASVPPGYSLRTFSNPITGPPDGASWGAGPADRDQGPGGRPVRAAERWTKAQPSATGGRCGGRSPLDGHLGHPPGLLVAEAQRAGHPVLQRDLRARLDPRDVAREDELEGAGHPAVGRVVHREVGEGPGGLRGPAGPVEDRVGEDAAHEHPDRAAAGEQRVRADAVGFGRHRRARVELADAVDAAVILVGRGDLEGDDQVVLDHAGV